MNETIVKVANKTENFTIVSNEVPRDNTLSARSKGIYFYLMTLPANWIIHKEEIYSHFSEGRDALDTAWNELVKAGYIKKDTIREAGKIVSNTWVVYESSRITEKPKQVKPVTGKPSDGKPVTDNPHLLSTDKLSTDNTNNLKQTKKTNVFSPVFETYISLYESIYGFKPAIVYSRITEQLKKITKDVTIDQVVLAIEHSRNDDFSKKVKHELGAILSGGVVGRLINESHSKPLPPKISVPRRCRHIDSSGNQCEGEIFNSYCKVCGAMYDGSGNEIL